MTAVDNKPGNHLRPGGVRELLGLAMPMIISTACDGIMTFTDRLFLAKLGPEQMNAAMGGAISLMALMFFFTGLTGYATALSAQYYGSGDSKGASLAAFQAVLVCFVAWPVIMLLSPLLGNFYTFMNVPSGQMEYQIQYVSILAPGSILGMMRHSLGCFFTGTGRTRIVMFSTFAALAVNLILDYVLIFGHFGFPAMGVKGAALATNAGAGAAMLILLTVYFGRENRLRFYTHKSLRFSMTVMKKLIYFGFPAGFELFMNFFAFSLMITIFHSKGPVAATASTIMFNWDMISYIPLLGIEIAVTSLVGRYMGAGSHDAAYDSAISGIKIGIYYSAVILALFIFLPLQLTEIFRPEAPSEVFESAVPVSVTMIRIASFYVLAEAVMVAIIGALRGAGDTYFTMFASTALHWLLVPILYVTLHVLDFSVTESWAVLVVMFLLFCGVLILRFKSGRWKGKL